MSIRQPHSAKYSGMTSQWGVSLIEMMVSLTIGLFLLAGMATIFSSTFISYNVQSGLSQLQNNELLAMNILSNVIESAGYYPAYPGNDTTKPLQTEASALPVFPATSLPANVGLNSLTAMSVTPTLQLAFGS